MSQVRYELDKVKSPLIELRHQRLALARQTSKMREQAISLETHRITGMGAHGVFGLLRKK